MDILASLPVWAAAFFAFWAGMGVQAARTAMENVRKTEESIPSLKKTSRARRFTAGRRLLIALAVATVITWLMARFH
ncbi:MAG TPA: hypothetical protein VIL37_02480 [Natronosporangium sp.]